ncbi:MAG: triose-phosphate isomerase [Candidatus Saccharimonadales bacterium]
MHLSTQEASLLLHRLHERIRIHRDVEVVIAPSMLVLQPLSMQIDRRKFRLAAQNAYFKDEGAFTGEVSFTMLQDLVHYAIIGHSDRRYKFNEDLSMVREKVSAAVRNNITPILCVGETKDERVQKETMQVLHDQITSAVANLTADEIENLVVAYEPVWALSSGTDYLHHEIPTPDLIVRAAQVIRHNIAELYGNKAAQKIRVLYGGSANASTAESLLHIDGINGLLVGGASLNYHEFSGIVDAAFRVRSSDVEANDG